MENSVIGRAVASIIKNMKTWVIGALVIAVAYGGITCFLNATSVTKKAVKNVRGLIAACILAAWIFHILHILSGPTRHTPDLPL